MGHQHIQYRQCRPLFLAKAQGLLAVTRSQHTIPEIQQGRPDRLAEGIVIFGKKNHLRATQVAPGRKFGRGSSAFRVGPVQNRQIHTKIRLTAEDLVDFCGELEIERTDALHAMRV